jgi:hypothetical protein
VCVCVFATAVTAIGQIRVRGLLGVSYCILMILALLRAEAPPKGSAICLVVDAIA